MKSGSRANWYSLPAKPRAQPSVFYNWVERADVVRRFLKNVELEPTRGCWLWKPSKDRNDYGSFQMPNKMYRAHRLSYMMFIGPVAEDRLICHECDVPSCVNPSHLFIGTNKTNAEDRERKGRGANGSGQRQRSIA